jgi:hypothetical protein
MQLRGTVSTLARPAYLRGGGLLTGPAASGAAQRRGSRDGDDQESPRRSAVRDFDRRQANSYRDRKDIAIAAAEYLKRKFPNSEVVVKHLPSGEVTVAAHKPHDDTH